MRTLHNLENLKIKNCRRLIELLSISAVNLQDFLIRLILAIISIYFILLFQLLLLSLFIIIIILLLLLYYFNYFIFQSRINLQINLRFYIRYIYLRYIYIYKVANMFRRN